MRGLIDDTLLRLGISSLNVELSAQDLAIAIQDALRLFNQYSPGQNWDNMAISGAVNKYPISQRNVIDVMDVKFIREYTTFDYGLDVIPDFFVNLGEIEQWFQRRNDAGRILSFNPVWESQWEVNSLTGERELVLYIDVPENTAYYCSYLYAWYRDTSDDLAYGLPSIPENQATWVEDYTLSAAKYILGRVLDKFKGIPSPGGFGLDGADLRNEALQEMETLKRDLISRKRQPPPIIG